MTVRDGEEAVRLGGPRQQTVLAVLLCHANHTVAQDTLIDAVWAGDPPDAAKSTLQSYVYGLRQALGSEQIQRQGDGYRIDVDADSFDALRFQDLVERGRERLSVDAGQAREAFVAALALWYGMPFGGLEDNPVVMTEAARLNELRLVAVEHRIDAELTFGNHDGVVGELRTLVRDYPLRERFHAQHMLALYRSGRQAEALEAFRQTRDLLGRELGLDPSSQLRDLERRILEQDPSLMLDESEVVVSSPDDGEAGGAVVAGRSLRGYELRDPLGQGDFGTVFRAFQPSVGREVAIKVIRAEYANRPAFVQRFEREAQLVAQLEHPHIVPLFDYWRDPSGAYLVMPLLRGGSLATALRRGGWNLAPALQVLEQVGGALAHAHRRAVVHRDVKPGNVLLDEDGNAYLSDFGIATRMSDDADVPLTTSLAYVPPEELRGEPQTPPSDVFALGVLTYELVTGVAPPSRGPLPAITGIRPELPVALEEALRRATDDSPSRRYEKVEDFLRDIRRSVGADVVDVAAIPSPVRSDEPIRNPYKGLRAFRETDAADFFGREAMVDELLEAVAGHNLVTVVGPSGSGKSSLVRAGLVPRLRAGGLPGSREWLVTDMFPGSYPFEELEASLRRVATTQTQDLLGELTDGRGLLRATKHLLPDDDSTLVLLVDQFEELFSAVGSEATRRLFLDNLVAVADDERSRVRVVLTLRADFFDRPLSYAEFAQAMAPGMVTVGPPSRDGLAQAIAAPARGVGVDLEPGLVGRIIADVEDQPGGLPLLQYTLTELFARRNDGELTVRDYEQTGGVTSALGRRAEELYAGLPSRTQEAARNLFLRLVTVDESSADTRRRARLSELRALAADQEAIDQVLHEYGTFRLLSFDRDPTTRGPTVEVAHEALLREWERLRTWIDDRREGLVLSRRVAMAAQDWSDSERDPSFLMRGARLEQVERWRADTDIALTEHEADFLDASLGDRAASLAAARRRRRRLVAALLAMLITVSAAAVLALVQRGLAQDQARDARVRELAGESALALQEDPERAALIALEAVELARPGGGEPLAEAASALHRAIQDLRLTARFEMGGALTSVGGELPAIVHGGTDELTIRSLTDGSTTTVPVSGAEYPVAASDRSGVIAVGAGPAPATAGVWMYSAAGEPLGTLRLPADHGVTAVDVSPSGDRVVALSCTRDPGDPRGSCTSEPLITVWDVGAGAAGIELETTQGPPSDVAFVADGRIAVAINAPAGIVLRDLDRDEDLFVPIEGGPTGVLEVDPEGTWVAVTSIDNEQVSVIDVAAAEVFSVVASNREATLVWSPDGQELAIAGNAGVVRIIDVESGEQVLELRGADDNLFYAAYTPDGRHLLASSIEGTWMWDVTRTGPPELGAIVRGPGQTLHYQLSADGSLLASYGPGAGLELIDTATSRPVATRPEAQVSLDVGLGIPNAAFTVVGTLDEDGVSAIRRIPDFSIVRQMDDCTHPLAFTPDGSHALVSGFVCAHGGDAGQLSKVVRVEDGEVVLELDHTWIFGGRFSPDGDEDAGRLLALTDQDFVELYDLETGQLVVSVSTGDVGSADAGHLGLAFDPTGRYLATGMSDGRVWVADVERLAGGAPIAEALVFNQVTHTGPAPTPALTSDGVVATSGFDGLVRLWALDTGDMLTEFRSDLSTGVPQIGWTADERELLYAADDNVVRRYRRNVDDLVALARELVTRPLTRDECLRHLGPTACDG